MSEEQTVAEAKRDAATARRQRILEGAQTRMDVVEGRSTTSTSSKLAAMRKRRFKSKKPTDATDEAVKEEVSTTKEVPEAPVIAITEEIKDKAAAVCAEGDQATVSQENNTDEPKKKYMGVARMRRKLIKEKQQKEPADTNKTSTAVKTTKKQRGSQHPATVPILMHVVTVLLLFVAGLDIGLHQGGGGEDDAFRGLGGPVEVLTHFAPRQEGGIHRFLEYTTGTATPKTKPSLAEPVWQDAIQEEADEFEEAASDTPDHLDPLFQVDLDKLTAGSGVLFWAARQAVKVHRFILKLFYYGPRNLFDSILSYLISPPILCLMAILLRQLVGNTILGAQLPVKTEGKEENKKDIVGMAKSFATGFLNSTFPTAVTFYKAWGHLRADMYVVLCGLFVGLAVTHGPGFTATADSSVAEEL